MKTFKAIGSTYSKRHFGQQRKAGTAWAENEELSLILVSLFLEGFFLSFLYLQNVVKRRNKVINLIKTL